MPHRGGHFWHPHKEHLYQRMVASGVSQSFVSVIYGSFAVSTAAAAMIVLARMGSLLPLIFGMIILVSMIHLIAVTRLESKLKNAKYLKS